MPIIKIFGGVLVFLTSLFSHPHTFIDTYFIVTSQNDKISKLHVKWKFDEMTSQLMLMEFDQNGDLSFDKKELAFIELSYFLPLSQFNYYTDIKSNNTKIDFIPINFNAVFENNTNLVYEFDIMFDTPKENLQIDIADEDMFSAFMVKEKFIKSPIPFKVEGIDNDFYFSYRIVFKK